jgi:hypothetical protein
MKLEEINNKTNEAFSFLVVGTVTFFIAVSAIWLSQEQAHSSHCGCREIRLHKLIGE